LSGFGSKILTQSLPNGGQGGDKITAIGGTTGGQITAKQTLLFQVTEYSNCNFDAKGAKNYKMIPFDTLCHVFWQSPHDTRTDMKVSKGIKRYRN